MIIVGGGIAGYPPAGSCNKPGSPISRSWNRSPKLAAMPAAENAVTAYPGARTIAVSHQESRAVRELLADFGVLQGDLHGGTRPRRAFHQLRAPGTAVRQRSRHDGLWPRVGVRPDEQAQFQRFQELMDGFQRRRGADGRKTSPFPSTSAPAIPICWHWIASPCGFSTATSAGCRTAALVRQLRLPRRLLDLRLHQTFVSAWMGIHYFASRDARARDADADDVLTWPEGNDWLVRRLGTAGTAYRHQIPGFRRRSWIGGVGGRVSAAQNRSTRRLARAVIWSRRCFRHHGCSGNSRPNYKPPSASSSMHPGWWQSQPAWLPRGAPGRVAEKLGQCAV